MPAVQPLFTVHSDKVKYTEDHIIARADYTVTEVEVNAEGNFEARPTSTAFTFKTDRKVPKVGVMLVGLGGNNGSTMVASLLAHRMQTTWETKTGVHRPDFFGSLTQASTVKLGVGAKGEVHIPFNSLLPMVNPVDFELDGWDISSTNLGDAMKRGAVLDIDLQKQLYEPLSKIVPRPFRQTSPKCRRPLALRWHRSWRASRTSTARHRTRSYRASSSSLRGTVHSSQAMTSSPARPR